MAHKKKTKRGQVHLCPTQQVTPDTTDYVMVRKIKPGRKHKCNGAC